MAKKETVDVVEVKQTKITDWYDKLLDDLWELAQTKVIELKHATGKRIIQDWDKFGKPEYGDKFVETLAKDLQISSGDVYRCIQFARKYPELDDVYNSRPGARITWKWIKKELLPEHKEPEELIILPEGKYNVIYADPPWTYNDTCEDGAIQSKGAKDHYSTMTIKQLCNLDIQSLCVDDAILFLWVTSPLLEECFEVINSWGFKYKASFIWDKIKHNMGHYNSVRHEFLLLCTKGSFTPENLKLFDSVVSVEKTKKHSQKPKIFYEMIEELYPSGKKIELFARNTRKDWDSWGNEI